MCNYCIDLCPLFTLDEWQTDSCLAWANLDSCLWLLFLCLVISKFAWHLPVPSSSLWWGRLGVPCVVLFVEQWTNIVLSLRFKVNVCVYVLCVYFAYILVGIHWFNLAFAICLCIWSYRLCFIWSLSLLNFSPLAYWSSAYVVILFGCALRHFPIYSFDKP